MTVPYMEKTGLMGERPGNPSPVYDELLTVQEVAAFLKVPVSWVYERTRRRGNERLPHLKMGKYLRFRHQDIVEWLDTQKI